MLKKILFAAMFLVCMILDVRAGCPAAEFHAQFDQDFHALGGPGGSTPGKHSQETLWETLSAYLRPGVSGNAALIGASSDKSQGFNIIYPAPSILESEAGAVAFWIQPIDWDVSDKSYHVFFRGQGSDADLIIYKVPNEWGQQVRLVIGPTRNENGRSLLTTLIVDVRDWKRGDWHFIVATWGNHKCALYIDGVQKKVADMVHNPGAFKRFGAGGLYPTKWTGNPGTSLIDELMIYNQMLRPEDVRERFLSYGRGFANSDDTTPVSPERLVTLVDIKNHVINVQFDINSCQGDGTPFDAKVEFLDANGKAVISKTFRSETPRYKLAVNEGDLPFGDYTLKVTVVRRNGQVAGEGEMSFRRSKRPEVWEGNSIGKQDIVPPPWTPLVWDGERHCLNCWNRSYIFGKSFMPEHLVSGNTELLASPVAFMVDGVAVSGDAQISTQRISDSAVDFIAASSNGSFSFTSKAHGEFDGFIWFDVTLTPKNGSASIKSLTLDFPFRKECATLFNSMTKFYLDYKPGYYGAFKAFDMDLYNVLRAMFIGNDHCGMEWVCEAMPDWHNKEPQKSLQLIPRKSDNLLRLNLIDHQIEITKPLTFSFGIQTTPIRPLPKKWRLLHAGRRDGKSLLPIWEATVRHASLNLEHIRPQYDVSLKRVRTTYGKEMLYLAGFTNNPYYPEWPYWCLTWSKTTPEAGFYGAINNPREIFAWNCPVPETQRDWYLYYLDNFLKKYDHKDLYFDNQCAQLCSNEVHGCGFRGSDGKLYPTYNIRATRDLAKRIYIYQKSKYPDALIMRHMSSKAVTPTIAFADLWLDGELYCKTVGVDESYKNIFDPEMFRACFRAENYGVPNYFIPQHQRAVRLHSPIKDRYRDSWSGEAVYKHDAELRHFIGYIIVHDGLVWPCWDLENYFEGIWKVFDDFGFNGEERFVMYNDPASPFVSQGRLMVSCYVLDGRVMIIVMNDTDSKVTAISYNAEKLRQLGVKSGDIRDAEGKGFVSIEKSSIKCSVPARDYRVFIIE